MNFNLTILHFGIKENEKISFCSTYLRTWHHSICSHFTICTRFLLKMVATKKENGFLTSWPKKSRQDRLRSTSRVFLPFKIFSSLQSFLIRSEYKLWNENKLNDVMFSSTYYKKIFFSFSFIPKYKMVRLKFMKK